jgi:MFS family permease
VAAGDLLTTSFKGEETLRYEGWAVVAGSGVGVFFASLAVATFAVFLKPLTDEFAWSREAVSRAFGGMTLGAALSAPFVGRLVDRIGAAKVCVLCLVGCGGAFASLALLTANLWHLYATFAVVGLAMTGTSAVVYARVVTSWFDRRRGVALAVVMASAAVGSIAHPAMASALIGGVGWRTAYLLLGLAGVAVGVPIVIRTVRERADAPTHRGAPIGGATVREALGSRVFWILIVVVFGSTLALNGVVVHLFALLTDHGHSAGRAAIVLSVLGAASLSGRLVTGWLLDGFLATRVAFALLAVAALGIVVLTNATTFAAGVIAAVFIGFGTGGEFDVVPYLLSRHFGLRSLSTLYGLHWTAWGIAGFVGPVLMGRAFDATGSYEIVLLGFASGSVAVAMLVLLVPDPVARWAR